MHAISPNSITFNPLVEDYLPHVMGQNSLTTLGEQNSLSPQENKRTCNLNLQLTRDQVVFLSLHLSKFVSRRHNAFAVFSIFELESIKNT